MKGRWQISTKKRRQRRGKRHHSTQQMLGPKMLSAGDAAFWDDVIDKNGLVIGNDGRPTNHWTRGDQEGESVIELTLAN
jgi:hypothetical protein